jgi:hypothetical protein
VLVCLFYKFSLRYIYFNLILHDGGGPIRGGFKHLELPKVSEAPKIHFLSYCSRNICSIVLYFFFFTFDGA